MQTTRTAVICGQRRVWLRIGFVRVVARVVVVVVGGVDVAMVDKVDFVDVDQLKQKMASKMR